MLRFHAMKHFMSCHETVCFNRGNTLFHPVKRTDTSRACFRPSAKDFALLVNEFGYFCIMIVSVSAFIPCIIQKKQ
jgi:hypothetical protein